ncbi:hypothetical protein F511_16655 [Dorcoceras hygrometricum]|uniref:Uncharacterized protein n=1 Tax=Dorcoceras hygrometricum TaxID=472368 RepID=A0A2Z7AV57_9LAMI|nr:hypothetical protein F511_16655 [Dorcoceras hygrometricum]
MWLQVMEEKTSSSFLEDRAPHLLISRPPDLLTWWKLSGSGNSVTLIDAVCGKRKDRQNATKKNGKTGPSPTTRERSSNRPESSSKAKKFKEETDAMDCSSSTNMKTKILIQIWLRSKTTKVSKYKMNIAETQAFDKHQHIAADSNSTSHLLRRRLTCTKKASEPRGSASKLRVTSTICSVIIFVKLMAQKLYLGPIALDRMTTDISFNVVKSHPI